MLDIHAFPSQQPSQEEEPLQILEAGTGHGALTLYLARAIHAFNPILPPEVLERLRADSRENLRQDAQSRTAKSTNDLEEGTDSPLNTPSESAPAAESPSSTVEQWKSQRGAVIHTLDISARHSHLAQKTLYGFRQGIYAGDVDFHVGDLSDWIDQRLQEKGGEGQESLANTPFLSHVILDLPSSHRYIEKAASALHVDGKLVVFNPSLTQIASCVELIRRLTLPLVLDSVVETGPSFTGGRDWDVRAVRPRALLKAEAERSVSVDVKDDVPSADGVEMAALVHNDKTGDEKQEEQARLPKEDQTGWEMVCRPKVGYRMIAGGFLGVWTKMKNRSL